jgi:hypothetical protein
LSADRIAYVGQRQYFASCVPPGAVFLDHRGGTDPGGVLAELAAIDPDITVVFRPEILPAHALDGLRGLTLGFNTEPLPRGMEAHPDQVFRLGELAHTDVGQFDRIMTFDPLSAQAAQGEGIDVWRSLPLPVADELFVERPAPMHTPPRALFLGYSTHHREEWLTDVKHHFDLLHIAHGVQGDRLGELFARTDVAVNVHAESYPSFENRVCLHLAAGHLVISEPLSPAHGLEPGIDYLEVRSPGMLVEAVAGLRAHDGWAPHHAIRARGRRKAETFRASRVWPRVLDDLRRDVLAFGTQRRTARTQITSS